jgi:O-antigen/teichoic acid export membrane protein
MSTPSRADAGLHTPPSAGKLMRFTGWNLFGLCAPMAVAFFALPPLRSRMGPDIYGAFIFVLTVVNYLTILDLGLGRATTRFMAVRLAGRQEAELPAIFWTAQGMMLAFALAGMAVFLPLIPSIVCHWSRIPPALQADVCHTLFVAAAGTPFLVLTASLVGVLEAHQKFRLISLIRVPMQVYTFLGPLAVALVTHTLVAPVAALLAGKAVECLIYFVACLNVAPVLRRAMAFRRGLVRDLFAFGGWMSVSSIAMLVLVQSNSALVFGMLPVAAVGVYGTVSEMVVRLLVFPRAWVSVLFPSFSAQHAVQADSLAGFYTRGVKVLLIATFPVMLLLVAFAGEGLALWQDAAFAAAGTTVMRWLVAGLFVYSLSYVPFSLLQGVGRPDLSARLHLIEVPLFIGGAWFLIGRYGMEGAGIAWFLRCVIEAAVMFTLAHRFAHPSAAALRTAGGLLLLALAMMGLAAAVPSVWLRLPVVAAEFILYGVLAWRWVLNDGERARVRGWVGRRKMVDGCLTG